MKKCYVFENVWKLGRNKDEKNEESQHLTSSAVQRRGAWTHVFTEQFLLGNNLTILISWWCSVKLGRKTKKKMMEEIHVCMCRACVYTCVHARLQGVGNKKTHLETSAENENQCSLAFTRWCQRRAPWWHSHWGPPTRVTHYGTHCIASRGAGCPNVSWQNSPEPASLASSALPPTLHSQNMMLCVSRHDYGHLGALVLGVLWIKLLWKFLYKAFVGKLKFSILLDNYLEVELLGHGVNVFTWKTLYKDYLNSVG